MVSIIFAIWWAIGIWVLIRKFREDEDLTLRYVPMILFFGLFGIPFAIMDFISGYKDYVLIKKKKTKQENDDNS